MKELYIAVGTVLCGQLIVFARWAYRRMRDDEINRVFVRDMATNHLPHIYHALGQIAGALEIKLAEPPPIQWIQLER